MALFKGKYLKLFTSNVEEPESDADFIMVGTENELTISLKVDVQTYPTKSYRNVKDGGDPQMTIKVTAETVVDVDAGLDKLKANYNKTIPFQVRDVSARLEANISAANDPLDKVYIEGTFLISEFEEKAPSDGLVEYTFTLESSGIITRNMPARAYEPGA